MQLKIHEFDMQLKYPFSISRHTYLSQPTIILELHYNGWTGYGEATINPYYTITIKNLRESFEAMGKRLDNYVFVSPDQLFDDFSDFLNTNSFALAALNNASWDLYGKMNNCCIHELIELPESASPPTSYTLGIDTPEAMAKKINDFPWPIYKVKLGTADDLELMRFLRKQTKSIFRVDANCAWNAEKTIELSRELKKLEVEFIEQPLAAKDPDQKYCLQHASLPLFADESCCTESDVAKCVDNFSGINIKLLKCGGLSPAISMIKNARELGLEIMIGCMTESSVGIATAAQLLRFVDYADLDGPLLLAEDLANGLSYKDGTLHVSDQHGLGINYIGK
jgi:L-alanine-DL-glutamate epimerase-like enolase superfamily enzyme